MGFFDKETETKSTQSVPGYIEDASKDLISKATDYANKPYESYTGDRVADMTGDQNDAFAKLRELLNGGGPGFNTNERVVDEDGRLGAISDYMNPYKDAALSPAIRKIMEASDAQRKSIGNSAASAGAFGDARHGILESDLNSNTQQAIGDTSSQFLKSAFDTVMGLRDQDLTRMDQNSKDEWARQIQGINQLMDFGTKDQATQQQGLDAMYEDFLRQYGHEGSVIDTLRNAISGSKYPVTTTTTQPDNSMFGALGSAAGSLLGTEAAGTAVMGMLAGL